MIDVEKPHHLTEVEDAAPQGMRYVHVEPATQKRVLRKLDMNLMPLVIALCMLHSVPRKRGRKCQPKV